MKAHKNFNNCIENKEVKLGLYKCVDMELKKVKNVLCLIVLGLLDLRACDQSDVTSAKRRGVFGDLRLSLFVLNKKWRRRKSM